MKRIFRARDFQPHADQDLSEELQAHLELKVDDLVKQGIPEEEAREVARRSMERGQGAHATAAPHARTNLRRRLLLGGVEDFVLDLRLTLRTFRKSPGFWAVSVLSLAVGIGVNSAVFTAIHGVWFAPVPGMVDQHRLVDMVPVTDGRDHWQWAFPDFEVVRDTETPLMAISAWAEGYATIGEETTRSERALVGYVTSDYFLVHGAQPSLGRGFSASDDEIAGENRVAILSHRMWKDRFDGLPGVLGEFLVIDGNAYTVVGVAPEGFRGARVNLWSLDLWLPLSEHPEATNDGSPFHNRTESTVQVLGRLREDATVSGAQAALRTVFANLERDFPESNEGRTVKAVRFGRFPAQNRDLDAFAVVGVCGLFTILLLIICGNLAGMAMARAITRERELGVRLALGASRSRLMRLLMLEAGVLSVVGGAVGVILSVLVMSRVSPMDLNITAPGAAFEPSGWMLVLSLALSFVAAMAFGLLPAVRFSRPELMSALKDDSGAGGWRVGRFQRYASSLQTGAAFLLLLLGVLFFRSLTTLNEEEIGFQPDGAIVADFGTGGPFLSFLDPSEQGFPSPAEGGYTLVDRLIENLGSVPGVSAVALSNGFPLDRSGAYLSVRPSGQAGTDSVGVMVEWTRATEGYFSVIGSPILQGRGILRSDDLDSSPIAVVSRSFADRLWPGLDPLGQQFTQVGGDGQRPWTVVGVIGATAASRATEDLPQVYLSLMQSTRPVFAIVLRSESDPSALVAPIREAVWSVDPSLPAPRVMPVRTVVGWATQTQTSGVQLAGGLGLIVLLLASIGIYGVVGQTVAARTREIGVRIAMGASCGAVVRGVVLDAYRTVGPGMFFGGILAAATVGVLRSTFLGLSPVDVPSFVSATGLVLTVVALASLGPALKGARIMPMDALRNE